MSAAGRRRAAYVDTSCLVTIAFGETEAPALHGRLSAYETLFASGLVEAELKAVLRREKLDVDSERLLPPLEWVSPVRPLGPEIDRVLAEGYLKGADAWHLACALYLDPSAEELAFETVDRRQMAVAERLGFGGADRRRRR